MENKEKKAGVATRAEKKDAAKRLIREVLEKSSFKSNDLIDEAAKLYAERYVGEDTENPNDVKGRIGSVIDVMKKDGEIVYDKGVYALKAETASPAVEEPPKKKTAKSRGKKVEKTAENIEEKVVEKSETTPVNAETEEKPKRTRKTAKKVAKDNGEKTEKIEETAKENTPPLPPAPVQPIAPVAPITPETAPEPMPEATPKKRGRKPKAKTVEETGKTDVIAKETPETAEKEQAERVEPAVVESEKKTEDEKPKGTLMDMSFLFSEIKQPKRELPRREEPKQIAPRAESRVQAETEKKTESVAETVEKTEKTEQKIEQKSEQKTPVTRTKKAVVEKKDTRKMTIKRAARPLTADEKLKDAFLSKLYRLGGDYFEYYSVYLLERYSRKNGRRLEALRVCGGEHDGGIDGELELTDRLGFRETIYIQAKNWNPEKGDERLWVVGETLLQQFIGACVCRQAKDGKQHCRGIFITTSRFTPEAKRILDETSDKFVGYDGDDLYETAKECGFGIVKKNGEYVLDEDLLSGEKAFFRTY